MILKEMQLGMTLAETDLTTPDKSAHRIRSVLELLGTHHIYLIVL